jgi:hypothetical protein
MTESCPVNLKEFEMLTRRTFLHGSVALTGLALTGATFARPAPALAAAVSPDMPLHAFIYDKSVAAGAAFGAAAGPGVSTYAIDGDITELWTGVLADQWRKQAVAIAGLTQGSALFLLERFGWDHGLRVVFRAEHRPQADGSVAHRLDGPAPMLKLFEANAAQHRNLGACMADVVGACPAHAAAPASAALVGPAYAASAADGLLYSWVIAPHARNTAG